MATINIIQLEAKHIAKLQAISIETFQETFGLHNTHDDMAQYLASHFNIQQLSKELSTIESFFYAVTLNNHYIGYMKLNIGAAQTEEKHSDKLEIERIYLLHNYQRQGIGKQLFFVALSKAKELQKKSIWLGVWEKNIPALAFYKQLGFIPFGSHIFMLGEDSQTDILLSYTW